MSIFGHVIAVQKIVSVTAWGQKSLALLLFVLWFQIRYKSLLLAVCQSVWAFSGFGEIWAWSVPRATKRQRQTHHEVLSHPPAALHNCHCILIPPQPQNLCLLKKKLIATEWHNFVVTFLWRGFFFSVVQAVKLEIVVAAAWERVNNKKEGKGRQEVLVMVWWCADRLMCLAELSVRGSCKSMLLGVCVWQRDKTFSIFCLLFQR